MLSCLYMGEWQDQLGNVATGETTLAQTVVWFETAYMPAQKLQVRTRREYRADVEQLIHFLEERGVQEPAEVGLDHLRAFIATFKQCAITRRKVFALKMFFHFLKQANLIVSNPAAAMIPPPHEAPRPRALNTQEYRALLGACAYSIRDRALIELLLGTGITLSEAVQLTMYDVDIYRDKGQLYVPNRGYKRRILPLDFGACHALDAWLITRPDIDNPALYVTKFKKPLGERSIQHIVRRYLTKARITNASVSSLRHTYAVQELLKGTDLPTLQQRLGLANRQDVAGYLPIVESMRKRVA